MENHARFYSLPLTGQLNGDAEVVMQLDLRLPEGIVMRTREDAKTQVDGIQRNLLERREGAIVYDDQGPLFAWGTIRFGGGCNLSCPMCIQRRDVEATRFDGADNSKAVLQFEAIKAYVLYLIRCAKKLKQSTIRLKLSGGEPTLYWVMLKQTIEFARQQQTDGIVFEFILETNLSRLMPEQLAYLATHIDAFKVSFDGLPQWHDKARPSNTGEGSSQDVMANLKTLIALRKRRATGIGIMINAVIWDEHIPQMSEAFVFMFSQFPGVQIRLSPRVNIHGPVCHFTAFYSEIIAMIKTLPQAMYSRLVHMFNRVDPRVEFCQVSGAGAELMPDSSLVTCSVAMMDRKIWESTKIGYFHAQSGKYIFDMQQRARLATMGIEEKHPCLQAQCSLIASCAGGCQQLRDQNTGLPVYMVQGACDTMREAQRQAFLRELQHTLRSKGILGFLRKCYSWWHNLFSPVSKSHGSDMM